MTATLTPAEVPKGTNLGKYEILRKLAVGGMAEIYLARARGEAGFEKTVVLKRILPNFAEDPQFVQMFLDEARLAATLQHTNIADVYDVGNVDGSYFFTMEFVHGEDARTIRIASRRANAAIPRKHALAIVHGTLSGLHYAHERIGPQGPLGLVHRDVSSSNILVSFDGAVKLVDFGIARASTRQHKTRTGTLKGKIPYMSPEQCKNQKLDRRSDLFSLGVVLYELTVGRRPFRGESDFEILDQIVNKGAVRPSKLDPQYPPALEAIVMRALERSADQRYQSGEQMLHELEEFMSAEGSWGSAMALGKYMRALFADKVAAWESAEQHGASLGDHVASTVTSESMRKAMRDTPISAFTAQPDIEEAPTQAKPAEPENKIVRPELEAVRPELRRRFPRALWLVLGGVAAAAVGYVLLAGGGGKANDNAKPERADPTAGPAPAPGAPTPMAAPAQPTALPAPEPTFTAKPAPPLEPTVAAPPATTTAVAPTMAHAPHRPPSAIASKRTGATNPPARTEPVAPEPSKPPPTPPAKPDKEHTWDRNSLTLPK